MPVMQAAKQCDIYASADVISQGQNRAIKAAGQPLATFSKQCPLDATIAMAHRGLLLLLLLLGTLIQEGHIQLIKVVG